MTGQLLSNDQQRMIEQYTASQDAVTSRKAKILLAYQAGKPTREVAHDVGLSRSRVRYWKQQFTLHGMNIFSYSDVQLPSIPTQESGSEPQADGEGFMGAKSSTSDLVSPPEQAHTDELNVHELPKKQTQGKRGAKGRQKKVSGGVVEFSVVVEELPYPAPMKTSGVVASDSMAQAGKKTLRYFFAEMLRHEEGTKKGEDIEALHDMRVATRRMRAAFDVFGDAFNPKILKVHLKGLRRTGRGLGHVRDLDVFMEKASIYIKGLSGEASSGLDPLLGTWLNQRELARQEMLNYLNSEDYQQFKKLFNIFLQTPLLGEKKNANQAVPEPNLVRDIAPVLVYSRLASVRAFDAILESATVSQLHALRIEFKKLRYTLEYFREVLGADCEAVIQEIKGLQDHLGDLNDADVACRLLNEFLQNWEANQMSLPLSQRKSSEPVVAYLAYRHAERHRLMTTFPSAWQNFNRPELIKKLAQAVSVL